MLTIVKRKDDPLEKNLISTSSDVFIANYNASVPNGFPQVTSDTLRQFQALYPGLFKRSGMFSIDRHRKKLMDWLSLKSRTS